MLALFTELGVDTVSVEPLIFAWKLEAAVPFEFSRSEFTEGCLQLGCDTIDKLRSAMRTCVLSFSDLHTRTNQRGVFCPVP